MEVRFKTVELAEMYQTEKVRRRVLGEQIAKAYHRRIQDLLAADNTAVLAQVPQLHFKAMAKGTPYQGKFSVRLSGMMRLILSIVGNVVTVEEVSKHYGDS